VDTSYGLRGRCELFLLYWRYIADRRVQAVSIVEPFDELEEVISRLLSGFVAGAVIEFGLHVAKEALYGRVVPAICFPAHGTEHAVVCEQTTIGMRCVLLEFNQSSQHLRALTLAFRFPPPKAALPART